MSLFIFRDGARFDEWKIDNINVDDERLRHRFKRDIVKLFSKYFDGEIVAYYSDEVPF